MEDQALHEVTSTTFFVAIAASAGGLEAASLLAQNLPKNANAVYILAQHMSPTHKSLLTSLISRETSLPVAELEDETIPNADTIYVPPPNCDVIVEDNKLVLRDPQGHSASPKPSADRLMKSLAAQMGEKCVGIVLSGTGSDGSYGVQAIREAGGITIAQEAATAKYDGMPSSAIETGCIDLTLTPEQMGQHLQKILSTPRDFDDLRKVNLSPSRLTDLLQILLSRTQVDFRDYKENTINRRISRRMVALGIDDYDDYVDFCRSSEAEVEALHRDLLISVTRFFRDTSQFEQLKKVVEEIVATRESRQVRVWVAGCATGEEAYSIAILIAEALGGAEMLKKSNVQIFASDIDERALEVGRRAIYPVTAAADIPKKYLDKYFEISGNNIQVLPSLRNVVLFSRHNVAQDPPFINVDLVSLRNILIYFNSAMQERVLRRVHYALNPRGTLFLGTSEAVGGMHPYFELRYSTDKIFGKRLTKSVPPLNYSDPSAHLSARPTRLIATRKPTDRGGPDLAMFEALARTVAQNGFMVTKNGEIIRVFGEISNVIELSEQSALNLSTRILRPGLRDEASSLISVALKSGDARTGRWHTVEGGSFQRVRLKAYPIANTFGGEDNILFSIEYSDEPEESTVLEQLTDEDRVKYVRQIEQEMLSTRETLQQTVEELQTSNEELQSVNEELQSTNEELQATNEELETSNEELQSTNEELITVNEEMQVNAAELQRLTVELSSVVQFAPYPILVIDNALLIRRVSDTAKAFFSLNELPPTGVHVAQVAMPEGFPGLASVCNDALRERSIKSLYFETGKKSFSLLVSPFAGAHDTVLGLMVTLIEQDITSISTMADAMDELGGIGHWRVNSQTKAVFWSEEIFRIHNRRRAQGKPGLEEMLEYYHPDDRQRLSDLLAGAMEDQKPFAFDARIVRDDKTVVPVRGSGKVALDPQGVPFAVVGALMDMSQNLHNSQIFRQFESVQQKLGVGFYSYDVDNDTPFWSQNLFKILGFDPKRHVPTMESAITMFHPEDRAMVNSHVARAIAEGIGFDYEARLVHSDGTVVPCVGYGQAMRRGDGSVSHVYGFFKLLNEEETQRAGW